MKMSERQAPGRREPHCAQDMGGSHYHCSGCGEESGMLGHFVGGGRSDARMICDAEERIAYLRKISGRGDPNETTSKPKAKDAFQAALDEYVQERKMQARDRAREAVFEKIGDLLPGTLGVDFANEIADHVIEALSKMTVR